jgi:hypothetical protein
MGAVADGILEHLRPLIGLELAIARRAADMRIFQFGPIRTVRKGTVGEYALHIQCPWRIEGPAGIVTGRLDLWDPADEGEDIDWDTWDYDRNENLQDRRLGALLGGEDPETRSFVNRTGHLVVEAVEADDCGGAVIGLSGGYRLVLFPAGACGEDWRILRPDAGEPHFVVAGGRIEPTE